MKALSPARGARAALVLLTGALALAAGCGGPSRARDAGMDSQGDAGPKPDALGGDTRADTQSKSDTANDTRVDGGTDRGPDADARDALPESRPDGPTFDAPQAFCPAVIPAVTPDSGTVAGVLKGASNNPAVSCRGGVPTLGPEAFFTLTVTQQMTVTFTVAAPVDTIVAIRPGACTDTISEIACGEQPPATDADAGVPVTVDAGPGRASAA